MLQGVRSGLRASWLTVSLAAALSVSLPAAASMAGVAAAAPTSGSVVVVAGARPPPRPPPPPPGPPAPAAGGAPPAAPRPTAAAGRRDRRRSVDTRWSGPSTLVHVPAAGIIARRNPWTSAPVVGAVASASKYYRVPIILWVEATNAKGTWGRVELPYVWPRVDGWIRLAGLTRETTFVHVDVDLSEHRVIVFKRDERLYSVAGATGAWSTPTPTGEYVVTDRVPFPSGGALGTFAFGISGIQPRLPAGWSGGDQLAIHGTDNPASIGTNASAGCVRVTEWALDRFKPLLRLGTPVLIHA